MIREDQLKDLQLYQQQKCDLLKRTLYDYWIQCNKSFKLRTKYMKLSEYAFENSFERPIFFYNKIVPFYGRLVLADDEHLWNYKEYEDDYFK